jgi:DNA-binding IclR family transcriptional regulator
MRKREKLMRRPALSALRAMQIINRLTANPRRAFTMSELMRDTGINVGSCHALLTALTDNGYLRRCKGRKTYTLGPVLAAVGQAAFHSQPLISHARAEAGRLMARIGHPIILTHAVGDEIVAIFSLDDGPDRAGGLRVGQRVPFAPPLGAPFVAWSSDAETEDWLARQGTRDESLLGDWRQALALVKQRGYQVTLRPPDPDFSMVMKDIANGKAPLTAREEWARYFESGDRRLLQPETIERDARYPVVLIAAPLSDEKSGDTYCLGITGLPATITGADIEDMARELLQSCMTIMRDCNA